ncbi:hypothetical protein [Frankia sp. QA3]|uniref:hypothetical protein n=1 Tax=Frankia sp. QA3 TaxID=710111 RepID=UPI000269BE6F|nr:hypothetical protein [Frankia sp. QA3]EIV93051.1 hypothetical protein FraQA3DRAFT_2727 [Frankia sp. QA3]
MPLVLDTLAHVDRIAARAALQQRRAELYRAAADLFVDLRLDEISLRDIAAHAGMEPVESARDYLAGTLERDAWEVPLSVLVDEFFRVINSAVANAGPSAEERLSALVRGTMSYYLRYQTSALLLRYRTIMRVGERFSIGEQVVERGASQLFGEIIQQGVREGVFRTPFPADARRSIEAAGTAALEWYDHAGPVPPDELIERYVRVSLATVEFTGLR